MTEIQTTTARVLYHGEVLDACGGKFVTIESETGGYAPLVTITARLQGHSGTVTFWISPEQSDEICRHLKNATEGLQPA